MDFESIVRPFASPVSLATTSEAFAARLRLTTNWTQLLAPGGDR